jgi:hypothetical protein
MQGAAGWGTIIEQSHDRNFAIRVAAGGAANGNLNFHIQNNNDAPYLPPNYGSPLRLLTGIQDSANLTTTMYYAQAAPSVTTGANQYPLDSSAPLSIGRSNGGSGEFIFGAIAEIRIYASVLSVGDRTAVETALRSKWGIP